MGPALGENPEKIAALWKELKTIRGNLAEVASLAQHLSDMNEVNMASLHFQQASGPLVTRLAALSEKYGQSKALPQITASLASSELVSVDKSSKKVSLSGWLRKQGEGKLSNSHRRYFLLDQTEPTQLRYYETDSLQKQKGYVPLDQMEAILVNDADKTMFGINTGDRVWMLQADTVHDARIWVKALSKWGERFQQMKSRKNQLAKELVEANNASSSSSGDVSPRPTDSSTPTPPIADSSLLVDESLIKLQQEAERREALRQQESARRWKEKQELRFQREAARLKEEANSRYLASSESHDLSVPSGPKTPSSTKTTPRETIANQSPVPTLQLEPTSEMSSTPTTPRESETSSDLRERLRAALRLKRERNLILADLLHQRSLFQALKAERAAEIKKIEDADPEMVQLREMRDESKLLASHLTVSITTYQQQIMEQDKLIGLIQGSVKQNEEKGQQLQAEIEKLKRELEALEPAYTNLSLELSAISVSRMVAHGSFKTSQEVEDKIDMLGEALKAHEDLAHLTRHTFASREASLQEMLQEHRQAVDLRQHEMDATRHRFQFFRSLLHTDAGYSITEEYDELQHDYFVAIVNSIKLNLIQEGHTLKLTSPSLLFAQAKAEGVVKRKEWPHWISNYIHSKCIESYPEKVTRAPLAANGALSNPHGADSPSDPRLEHIHARTTRKRVKNHHFGASFGGNFGGGGLGMF
jgi:hypothetical protein